MTGIKVSLLPSSLKKQSSRFKMWTMVALVLAIIAMIFLAANILFSFYLNTPVEELDSLRSHNKNMTDNVGRLAYIQEMFDQIESNNNTMKILKGNSPDWAYVIETTTGDPGMYGINIARVEIMAAGEIQGCLITATTKDVKNIEAWSNYVASQENIADIVLGSITTNSTNDGTLLFHFEASIAIDDWNRE